MSCGRITLRHAMLVEKGQTCGPLTLCHPASLMACWRPPAPRADGMALWGAEIDFCASAGRGSESQKVNPGGRHGACAMLGRFCAEACYEPPIEFWGIW
jgi:hypothetical protein